MDKDTILVAGGGANLKDVIEYHWPTGTSKHHSFMNMDRKDFTLNEVNGVYWAVGGHDGSPAAHNAEYWDTNMNEWLIGAEFTRPITEHCAVTFAEKNIMPTPAGRGI